MDFLGVVIQSVFTIADECNACSSLFFFFLGRSTPFHIPLLLDAYKRWSVLPLKLVLSIICHTMQSHFHRAPKPSCEIAVIQVDVGMCGTWSALVHLFLCARALARSPFRALSFFCSMLPAFISIRFTELIRFARAFAICML